MPRAARSSSAPKVRPVRLHTPDCAVERKDDGVIVVRAREMLDPCPARITDHLVAWAGRAPDRIFMAERAPGEDGWRSITYAQTLDRVRRIGAALLTRNLSAERPIAILSGNDLDHALLGLAAAYVGIPHAPISPAYSLVSTDFGKLRHVFDLLTPGLVFAADGAAFARAIAAVVPPDIEIVTARQAVPGRASTEFADLSAAAPGPAVATANARVGPDTVVKILFTSGSTGLPKGVTNTQRMWCSNQAMIRTALAYFRDEPPVVVDWAPWHHTAGGNHDVGLVLANGGTFYIDAGKPLPGQIEETVRNLREIAPTWYFTVPKGFEALLPFLRDDRRLRETFFSRLKVLWFAGAGLAQQVFDDIRALAVATCGEEIMFLTGFGATETAPCALVRTFPSEDVRNMGLPAVGMELKLVPFANAYEARVKGPNITPGYWRQPALTAAAFDDDGFYRLGDAFTLADADDIQAGLLFGGRIAEDFKLATGTWVNVGPLRTQAMAHLAPLARDVVIAGEGRDDLAILAFPDFAACKALCPGGPERPADLIADPRVRSHFARRLRTLAQASTGSSNRIARAILLAEPPSLDAGEMTDKGSLNQRAVLARRAEAVEQLYAEPPPLTVITLAERT